MIIIKNSDLDLKMIAESGQCFRMEEIAGGQFRVIAKDRILYAQQLDEETVRFECSEEEFASKWKDYFDLDADYAAYRAAVDTADVFLTGAAEAGRGIRILRQDPWEMLVTFIVSQRKNIPAIKACVEALCRKYGRLIDEENCIFAFPTPQALAAASEDDLKNCSLGYRVPYVKAAAEDVCSGKLDLDAVSALSDEELLEALMTVRGVGPKVANCISLFAYHRIAAFPVDVWIGRMLEEHYGGVFPLEKYEGFAGIMQQYIFYHAIHSK